MNQKPIKLIIADDHKMILEAITHVMEKSKNIEVVAQIQDATSFVTKVSVIDANVLLLDYSMPKLNTLSVIEILKSKNPSLKICVFSLNSDAIYAVNVLEAGGDGYVVKSDDIQELILAINQVFQGRSYISQSISSQVLQILSKPKKNREGLDLLSAREFELFELLANGTPLTEAANSLNVSVSTASTYRTRILTKLNLSSTSDLVRYAAHVGNL